MEWKDTGDAGTNPEKRDPYYDDDGYGAFKEKGRSTGFFSANPINYLYWGLGIAVVIGIILLGILMFSYNAEPEGAVRISDLKQRIEQLEKQLEKVNGVDEKVTHIWEQAKAFETFKTRFDRSEASTSLRMDHLAMSLDALQKKADDTLQKVNRLEKTTPSGKSAAPPATPVTPTPTRTSSKPPTGATSVKTHTVVAGDTLYSISRKYNLTVQQLRSMNNLGAEGVIRAGQKLTVQPAAGQ